MKRFWIAVLGLAVAGLAPAARGTDRVSRPDCDPDVIKDLMGGAEDNPVPLRHRAVTRKFLYDVPPGGSDDANQIRLPKGALHSRLDLGSNASAEADGNGLCPHPIWYFVTQTQPVLDAWKALKKVPANTDKRTYDQAGILRDVGELYSSIQPASEKVLAQGRAVLALMDRLGALEPALATEKVKFQAFELAAVRAALKPAAKFDLVAKHPGDVKELIKVPPAELDERVAKLKAFVADLEKLWAPKEGKPAEAAPGEALRAYLDSVRELTAALHDADAKLKARSWPPREPYQLDDLKGPDPAGQDPWELGNNRMGRIAMVPDDHKDAYTYAGHAGDSMRNAYENFDLGRHNELAAMHRLVRGHADELKKRLIAAGLDKGAEGAFASHRSLIELLEKRQAQNQRLKDATEAMRRRMPSDGTALGELLKLYRGNSSNSEWLSSSTGQQAVAALTAGGLLEKDGEAYRETAGPTVYQAPDGTIKVKSGAYDNVLPGASIDAENLGVDLDKETDKIAEHIASRNVNGATWDAIKAAWELTRKGGAENGGKDFKKLVADSSGADAGGCSDPTLTQSEYRDELRKQRGKESARLSGERQGAYDVLISSFDTVNSECASKEKELTGARDADDRPAIKQAIQREIDALLRSCESRRAQIRADIEKVLAAQEKHDRDYAGMNDSDNAESAALYVAQVWKGLPKAQEALKADRFARMREYARTSFVGQCHVDGYFRMQWVQGTTAGDGNAARCAQEVQVDVDKAAKGDAALKDMEELTSCVGKPFGDWLGGDEAAAACGGGEVKKPAVETPGGPATSIDDLRGKKLVK